MSDLDAKDIQCMTRCESLSESKCMEAYGEQDGDMEDLM